MKNAKKKPKSKRLLQARRMSSDNLCNALSGIAAFHVEDEAARLKIYEAIRRLQVLDDAAKAIGLLEATPRNRTTA